MNATRFHGIVPPVVTPFTATGDVDFPALEALVEHLIASGVHGLFVLGSSAEVAYLTDSQRAEVVAAFVRVSNGRVPIIAGAIEMTTARVIEQARVLEAAGVDAIVTTAAIYAINDAAETERHFRAISAAISVPLFAYDVPVRVHSKLSPEMLVRLGTEGVIVGVKDSTGDDVGFRRLVAQNKAAGSPLALFTGHEVVVDGMLLLGADGVVPGLANVDAAGYVRLWDAAQAGDWAQARIEQDRIAALFEIVFLAADRSGDAKGIGAFKAAMKLQGIIPTAEMAFPVIALGDDIVEHIVPIVREAGLLNA